MTKNENQEMEQSGNRCPGMSYSDMLDLDTREVPEFLIKESPPDFGPKTISADRYTSESFQALENEKMWRNVWQFAAREEDFQKPGENVVYENAGRSYVIVRQEDGSIRAFHNVCLHRGRKIRTRSGYAAELKCPFHGFSWKNDGSLKEIPCAWDFDHLKSKDMSLPELKVARWQGFVMVTENPDIEPFEEWIGEVSEHFERWKLDECSTVAWIGRVIPANWKVVSEAFMEAWHSIITHPQILPFTGDANTRYDIYGDHANRAITPSSVLSPHIASENNQQHVLDSLFAFAAQGSEKSNGKKKGGPRDKTQRVEEYTDPILADNQDPVSARKIIAELNRQNFGTKLGVDLSEISDTEMNDNFTYNIFPNFAPWGGFIPNIVYRWRPAGDPDHCLMEVRILMRGKPGDPLPPAPPMHLIGEDEPFASAAHLIGAGLASVFDQDMANLPYVQEGLKASANKQIELGQYQESRITHFHRTMDKYIK